MTGQAASRTILSISPRAWSELAPSPTSATSGRAITSWPSATTIGTPAQGGFALVGDQDPQMLGLAGVRERIHPPIVKPARSQDFDEGAPGGE